MRQTLDWPSDSCLSLFTNGRAKGSQEEARGSFLLKHPHLNIKVPKCVTDLDVFVLEFFHTGLPGLLLLSVMPTFIALVLFIFLLYQLFS